MGGLVERMVSTVYGQSVLPCRGARGGADAHRPGLNDCSACGTFRAPSVQEAGVTEEMYEHVADPAAFPGYTDRQRLAIEYAERFATDHRAIDDELFVRIRAAFTDPEVLDLTTCCAVYVGLGRTLEVLGIDQSLRPRRLTGRPGRAASRRCPATGSSRQPTAFHRLLVTVTGGRVGWKGARACRSSMLRPPPAAPRGSPGASCSRPPIQEGGSYVVVAPRGGDDVQPALFLNLSANPDVEVRFRDAARSMRARVVAPEDRPALWAKVIADFPHCGGYQSKTEREIPLVYLDPVSTSGTPTCSGLDPAEPRGLMRSGQNQWGVSGSGVSGSSGVSVAVGCQWQWGVSGSGVSVAVGCQWQWSADGAARRAPDCGRRSRPAPG